MVGDFTHSKIKESSELRSAERQGKNTALEIQAVSKKMVMSIFTLQYWTLLNMTSFSLIVAMLKKVAKQNLCKFKQNKWFILADLNKNIRLNNQIFSCKKAEKTNIEIS